MEIIALGLGLGAIAIVPLGAITKAVYDYGPRLTVLETNYRNLDEKLEDLKAGQKTQSEKLDRLIERFL